MIRRREKKEVSVSHSDDSTIQRATEIRRSSIENGGILKAIYKI